MQMDTPCTFAKSLKEGVTQTDCEVFSATLKVHVVRNSSILFTFYSKGPNLKLVSLSI